MRTSRTPQRPSLTPAPAIPASGRQWIFGYGSLAHVENLQAVLARHDLGLGAHSQAELIGFARSWSVAMDNSQTLPHYKYYLDARTGVRPDVFVAFANIECAKEARVSGLLFEVDEATLAIFDARERNYQRTDVSAHLSLPTDGTVWTYLGSPEANARFHDGLARNALVIDKAYAQSIATAFARARLPYAPAHPPGVPLVALTRIDT